MPGLSNFQVDINGLMALHAMGHFADMEARARRLLAAQPASAILNELLGIALSAQQRHAEAIEPLQRAVTSNADDAQFWENLALCQHQLGKSAEAETSLRKSLALRPHSVEALNALGRVLRSLERRSEAQRLFEQALALRPNDGPTHAGLAKMLSEQDNFAEAAIHFRSAIASNPDVPEFHYELGLILMRQGFWREAETHLRRCVALDRKNFDAYAYLAQTLIFQLRRAEAGATAEAALRSLGDLETNVSATNVALLDIVADALSVAGHYGDALQVYKAAYAYEPSPARAIAAIAIARNLCDWQFSAQLEADACRQVREDPTSLNAAPGPLMMMASATAVDQLAVARNYSRQFAAAAAVVRRDNASAASPHKRIRVGYVSNDFSTHATSRLIVGVVEAHDRTRFETVAYDYSPPSASDIRRRLETAFDRMVPIHELPYNVAAQRIADDQCDIVVDLKGWTTASRSPILAGRPGTLQVQWLGFPGSLGAPWIDYIVADRIVIPPGEEASCDEKVIRLPDTYQPNDDKRQIADTGARCTYGLPDNAFAFCSFNQAYKITPDVFDTWMKLLRMVDGSVLWLLDMAPEAADALRRRAVHSGIAAERIVYAPRLTHEAHLARIACADLALDCLPVGSHTTASDALWAGVPLIALKGNTFVSRVSASIVTAAGLAELVTTSLGEYFELALKLATDGERLAQLRGRVGACRHRSALFDTRRFTRHLETAFVAAWERHAAGLPPDHISVS